MQVTFPSFCTNYFVRMQYKHRNPSSSLNISPDHPSPIIQGKVGQYDAHSWDMWFANPTSLVSCSVRQPATKGTTSFPQLSDRQTLNRDSVTPVFLKWTLACGWLQSSDDPAQNDHCLTQAMYARALGCPGAVYQRHTGCNFDCWVRSYGFLYGLTGSSFDSRVHKPRNNTQYCLRP